MTGLASEAAFDFLATRRSRPAKTLTGPGPDRAELTELLKVASRVPDHGALVPWRFVVLEQNAVLALGDQIAARADALGLPEDQKEKAILAYRKSPICVAVVHVPRSTEKIPASEQILTGGAVCLSLVNAALAKGWGANWISGWASYDSEIMTHLGLVQDEEISGLVHIGTETMAPPERPRPEVDDMITWREA